MKTLYNRLSDENKAKIEEELELLPTSMLILKQCLKFNYSWSCMTISDAMDLHSALEPTKPFDLSRFINFFNEK